MISARAVSGAGPSAWSFGIEEGAVSSGLARFNALPADEAQTQLRACCAAPAWAATVAGGRPYPDLEALLAAARTALESLTWQDVAHALAGHPRIGERAGGDDQAAAWSRREQASVAADPAAATAAALVRANREYEQRFGHIFLIFASGRTPAQILDAARERLGHDEATERAVVKRELSKITMLRLERMMTE
jgi:2-oxo-4-hydroxy-4-carboxy-5-ureidoimidazoline decarboxylase